MLSVVELIVTAVLEQSTWRRRPATQPRRRTRAEIHAAVRRRAAKRQAAALDARIAELEGESARLTLLVLTLMEAMARSQVISHDELRELGRELDGASGAGPQLTP